MPYVIFNQETVKALREKDGAARKERRRLEAYAERNRDVTNRYLMEQQRDTVK